MDSGELLTCKELASHSGGEEIFVVRKRDISVCLILLGVFFRDCEDEEVQFDADSFMDTVGNLLGEALCYITSLNVFCLLRENLGEKE